MNRNSLLKDNDNVIRVLAIGDGQVFVIDCCRLTIPKWVESESICKREEITELEFHEIVGILLPDIDSLDAKSKAIMNERFTVIAEVLPVVTDFQNRNKKMQQSADAHGISKQTVRNYLCAYLAYQTKAILAPKPCLSDTTLSKDEKNMRWALNKYFYSQDKNSLRTAYTMMLKEKYCDSTGGLLTDYPTFCQFQYFYKKSRKMQNYYISREGLSHYQRNKRPLLGDARDFASSVGVGMLDATVLDIYLVDESGNLTGRPTLTICVDGFSSLIMGYMLSWEGGVYSLRGLLLNIITDKVEYCKAHGISIDRQQWDCDKLPGKFVTDRGSEYTSFNFENVCELGIVVENLPAYRAELKGICEKAFDLIQGLFKPYLKGKGIVEPDFQERGKHDYRKDACLTLNQFEKILLHCIVYYNSQRVVNRYPYSVDMIHEKVQPYPSEIFNWGKKQIGANLISVCEKDLILCLMPRTGGRFTRYGLKVNGLRYRNPNYTEMYLRGGNVTVAYNPDDVSAVWLLESGDYVRFELAESRFDGLNLSDVEALREAQKSLAKGEIGANTQARIDLANHIQAIAQCADSCGNTSIKGARDIRQKERVKNHVDYGEGLR